MTDCPRCHERSAVETRDLEWFCLRCGYAFDSNGVKRYPGVADLLLWESVGRDVPV